MASKKYKAAGIPFGVRASDGSVADICDVERGLACECICPSCKAPLNAKKGDIKEWYFAHASKNGHRRNITDCEFSFFVSARMMAKKILRTATSINLPAGFVKAGLSGRYLGVDYSESVQFTRQKCFEPAHTAVETDWNGVLADAVMEKDGYQLAIFFSCPDKKSNYSGSIALDGRSGALEINLSGVPESFYERDLCDGVSFSDILRRYVVDAVDNKVWLYHPNMAAAKLEADRLFKERLATGGFDYFDGKNSYMADRLKKNFSMSRQGTYNFSCAMCCETWTGSYHKGRFCRSCQTHLYVTERGPVS